MVLCGAVSLVLLGLTGCAAKPPDRHQQAAELTQQLRGMPGVLAASSDVASSFAQAVIHVWMSVEVSDDITGDQLAAITSRYLDGLRAVDYSGYRTELDVHAGGNRIRRRQRRPRRHERRPDRGSGTQLARYAPPLCRRDPDVPHGDCPRLSRANGERRAHQPGGPSQHRAAQLGCDPVWRRCRLHRGDRGRGHVGHQLSRAHHG